MPIRYAHGKKHVNCFFCSFWVGFAGARWVQNAFLTVCSWKSLDFGDSLGSVNGCLGRKHQDFVGQREFCCLLWHDRFHGIVGETNIK